MPPKGKHQLNQNEILIIERWIKSGASFEDIIDTISNNELVKNVVSRNTIADKNIIDNPEKVNSEITETEKKEIENNNSIKSSVKITSLPNPAAISPAIIQDFKQENIILTNIAEGSNFVMANFVNVVPFNKASLQTLKNINEQLVILKLTNLAIDDNDLKIVTDLKNIKKLNLENSLITDDGMAYIKQLSQLEQLNLYGTNISDEGLIQLTSLKNLSQIYLWKTKVTKGGIEQFKKIHPKVTIEIGDFKFEKK
jgi:Leucine-rich repeat (LRR) protein